MQRLRTTAFRRPKFQHKGQRSRACLTPEAHSCPPPQTVRMASPDKRSVGGSTELFFCYRSQGCKVRCASNQLIVSVYRVPQMQGVGCADVLLYFKYPTTKQMRCPVNAYVFLCRSTIRVHLFQPISSFENHRDRHASRHLRAPARNNSTSCLSFGSSTALHPPTRISICAAGCAL